MKRIFTLSAMLVALFSFLQPVSALTYTVTVPEGTNACFIVGEMNGWNTSASRMTKVDATHFTIDLPDATVTQQYKYCSGPDWKYVEKDAAGNELPANRTWTANDVVAKWANTFVLDERDVTIEVLVPSAVKVVYLVGAFDGWKSPSETYKMTFVSEDTNGKVFTKTVHSIDAKNMEFKFCAGPAWSYEQKDPKDNFTYGSTNNTASFVVNEFKAIFDPDKTGTINITATVPAGTEKVWIMGDFLGWSWDNKVEGVKNTDGTFSFSIPLVMSIEYRLYNSPDWGHPEVGEANPTAELPNRKAAYPANANTAINVWGWKQTVSAVEGAKADYFKLYTSKNSIVVEGVEESIELFDLSGRNVETVKIKGNYTSKELNKGIYIIRIDNTSRKVIVK